MSERDRLHDLTYLTAVLCFIGFYIPRAAGTSHHCGRPRVANRRPREASRTLKGYIRLEIRGGI